MFASPGVTGERPMAIDQVRDTPDPLDLDAVVDRAVAGDAVALEHLLGRVHFVAVRYCRSRMSAGHRSLASPDDVAQEVCMAVLTALPTFRHEGRPFPVSYTHLTLPTKR